MLQLTIKIVFRILEENRKEKQKQEKRKTKESLKQTKQGCQLGHLPMGSRTNAYNNYKNPLRGVQRTHNKLRFSGPIAILLPVAGNYILSRWEQMTLPPNCPGPGGNEAMWAVPVPSVVQRYRQL